MTKITNEDVLKLAKLSRIEILEDEVEVIAKQLQDALTYSARVKEIAGNIKIDLSKNSNVFADDIIQRVNPDPILEEAPEREDDFFVVPKIIEENK